MGSTEGETRLVKALLDTNVIIDYALEREPFWPTSEQVFLLIEAQRLVGYVSASTFGDLYYIIRKQRGHDWTLDFLTRLAQFCQVATVNQTIITAALTAQFKDFEDAIQYAAALDSQVDVIVTRNAKDFVVTTPRVMTPDRLIQEFVGN
jgi:predicted nucleic acid-binding protein